MLDEGLTHLPVSVLWKGPLGTVYTSRLSISGWCR